MRACSLVSLRRQRLAVVLRLAESLEPQAVIIFVYRWSLVAASVALRRRHVHNPVFLWKSAYRRDVEGRVIGPTAAVVAARDAGQLCRILQRRRTECV